MKYIIGLAVSIFLILVLIIVLSAGRSMAVKRFAVMELLLIVILLGGFGYTFFKAYQFLEEISLKHKVIQLDEVAVYAKELDELDLSSVADCEAYLAGLTEVLPYETVDKKDIPWNTAILTAQLNGYEEIMAVDGTDAFWEQEKYEEVICSLMQQTFASGRFAYDMVGHDYAVAVICDSDSAIPENVLCVQIPMEDTVSFTTTFSKDYFLWILGFFAIGTAAILITVLVQQREWNKIVDLMQRIAVSRDELRRPRFSTREMGVMWNSLCEISKGVTRNNYEKYRTYQAYYRFAPKQIEKILNKESITDVYNGDMVEIEGIAVIGRLAGEDNCAGREYIYNMEQKYAILHEQEKQYGGIMLRSDCTLNTVKYLFMEEVMNHAVEFGVGTMTRFEESIFLMHKSCYTYGVVGDEERSVTYMTSRELLMLEQYLEPLRGLGVRLVVTAETQDCIPKEMKRRYIGYIDNGRFRFDLYEVLTVYPDKERRARIRMDEKLQEGIQLFYRNDFYLARNAFSEVLKECEQDGVAKWYLFTCEYWLNQSGAQDEVEHGLFWKNQK